MRQTALQRAMTSACNMIPGRVGPYRLNPGWFGHGPGAVPAVEVISVCKREATGYLRLLISPNLVMFLRADFTTRLGVLRMLTDLPWSPAAADATAFMLRFRRTQVTHGAYVLEPSAWYSQTCMGRYGSMPGNRTAQALRFPFRPVNEPAPETPPPLDPDRPVYPCMWNAFAPGVPDESEEAGRGDARVHDPNEDYEDDRDAEWWHCAGCDSSTYGGDECAECGASRY